MPHTLTTCTFCGVGCGIYLETAGNRIQGAYPSLCHPTNGGHLCVRGWHVNEVASAPDRLTRPLLRSNGQFREIGWGEAFGFFADRLKSIRDRHGPDAVGFLNSPRCGNEETYLLQKFARCLIGTNNVDHGRGAFRHNSIDILLDMLGVPASTTAIRDLDTSDAILVCGVDLGLQLPTIGGRVMRAKLNKGARLIVIDPRRHRLAEHADCFLQVRPGTDAILYGAMAKVIVDRGLADTRFIKAHCGNAEAFFEALHTYDLLWAADTCGLTPDAIEEAAVLYGRAAAAAILFSTGVEARGTPPVQAIVTLVLLSGNLGRPGAGLLALAEHNNLQGVCDMGMLPDRFPGYVPVGDAAGRARLEELWGGRLPAKIGLDAQALLRAGSGLKALWLCRHEPVVAASAEVASVLERLDFVVVQHTFLSETTKHAHLILPVAAFGAEQATFTNTERRIQLVAKAVEPQGDLTPAWRQIVALADAVGAVWSYGNATAVMDEIGRAVPAYAAASYNNLARDYGRQWPCTHDKPLGTRDLFEDGIPDHGFRFVAFPRPTALPYSTPECPFVLSFGHSLYYWHQNVLVQHSETLRREYQILLLDYPEGFVDINDVDARALEIRDGSRIRLVAPTGAAVTTARVTPEVKRGMIFVPYFLWEVREQILGATASIPGSTRAPVCVRIERA
ncbi:MAG: molybdopterin-dependent oxidoreductase [candidate division NC10 bacterium]|nr:molybdopterin-dependent oxidoreductase [candidate division NC10 bacterium]